MSSYFVLGIYVLPCCLYKKQRGVRHICHVADAEWMNDETSLIKLNCILHQTFHFGCVSTLWTGLFHQPTIFEPWLYGKHWDTSIVSYN